MPSLIIGDLAIPYELRRSATAIHARITMTPEVMVVVVPEAADETAIELVLRRKRRWIAENRHRMRALEAAMHKVARFASGAKIPYRGRMARLDVSVGEEPEVRVSHRNGFRVTTPRGIPEERLDAEVELALRLWLRRKVRDDAHTLVGRYGAKLAVKPSGVHVKDLKHLWGSCGIDRSITLNWHLVHAPLAVLEYAVLHEMAHLMERNHGPAFWSLVRSLMPDFEARKVWLEEHEHLLGYTKLVADESCILKRLGSKSIHGTE